MLRFFRSLEPVVNARANEQLVQKFFREVHLCVAKADAQNRERDRTQASAFNVFEFIEPDENRLSDILQMLLDPRGEHGQGEIFLRLFLRQLRLDRRGLDISSMSVQREARTHGILRSHRRIDILIEGGVHLAIENKVHSRERIDQVPDYLEHLRFCARRGKASHALIYLSPEGRAPERLADHVLRGHQECRRLFLWGYGTDLRCWLNACQKRCAAPAVSDFLRQFLAYIDHTVVRTEMKAV